MVGAILESKLAGVAERLSKVRVLKRQTGVWLLLPGPAIVAIAIWPVREGAWLPEAPVLLFATILGALTARLLVRRPTLTEVARLVEQTDTELRDAVITAVHVLGQGPDRSTVLSEMALQDCDELVRHRDWSRAVPRLQILKWTVLSLLSFLLMVSSVVAANRLGRDLLPSERTTAKDDQPSSDPSTRVTELVVEPGDTEVERGAALTVVAKFPGTPPRDVVLEFEDSAKVMRRLAMKETVDASVFAVRMEDVAGDGRYRVLYGDAVSETSAPKVSRDYRVTTYVRPAVEQIDAEVTPPAWTGQASELVEDVGRLTVTEGSVVRFLVRLNKPVALAELRTAEGVAVPLVPLASEPTVLESTLTLSESQTWVIALQDSDGRTPVDEPQLSVRVMKNQPAKIQPTFPGRDVNVSPLQEFLTEAKAADDFGLLDYGMEYSLSGGAPVSISLKPVASVVSSTGGESAQGDAGGTGATALLSVEMSGGVDLEELGAAPDDMLTYSYWATDRAADGSERRSYSDLMFAEVRRFEEILRESQQSGSQQQQQQQQQQQNSQSGSAVDGVLNLQKEIVSATWNLIRSETEKKSAGTWMQDIETLEESQRQAMQQLQESMSESSGGPEATALAASAASEMERVLKALAGVRSATDGARLADALPLEQKVIQTLLRMRAAEAEVRQQQQQQGGGGGGGGGSSASQQQLQQLELDNTRNRYETERQAQQQQESSQQQREELQVLNRLKELAGRQQMVNERLKQLESELRAARTDPERDEIERELKRLRDEQREMLRDVDELSERLQQAPNAQEAPRQELQQQMQEARQNVQQASRAMDEGRLSEAIAEGTRAERQFDTLKEEFRNQTSSRFDDAVRDLREQARELSEQQEQIARQLSGQDADAESATRPSLKSDRNREQIEQALKAQRDRLSQVLNESKQLIEQAEESEPLLSGKLYETLRDVRELKPEEALEAAEMLAGRGLWPQTQEADQIARRGLDQLRSGIEQAADAVLGSEAESLRRAQEQLQSATQQLEEEVRNATGQSETEAAKASATGQQPSGETSQESPSGTGEQSMEREPSDATAERSERTGAGTPGDEPPPDAKGAAGTGAPSETRGESAPDSARTPAESERAGETGRGAEQREREPGAGESESPSGPAGTGAGNRGASAEPPSETPSGTSEQPSAGSFLRDGGRESRRGAGANNAPGRPLTGAEFSEWSDQLREVEEMLEDPELRSRVAQVRDRARAIRAEFRRHGTEPQWNLVQSRLLNELQELQQRISQELQKRESSRAMVPIDREPVPEEFDALVQRYYELLGQEKVVEQKK
jgi:hypothetical protein